MKNLHTFLILAVLLSQAFEVVTGSGIRGDVVMRPTLVAENVGRVLQVTHAGDESGRLFFVDLEGFVWVYKEGGVLEEPFLDLSNVVLREGESGLLGLTFHPGFELNGRCFVTYVTRDEDQIKSVLAEFEVEGDRVVYPERRILEIDQATDVHKGGQVLFGPDGYLYMSTGDGGPLGDPRRTSQDKSVLLGKILRIDVDHGDPYAIPPLNPFVDDEGAAPEIYALGLRNPWRFSFDRGSGRLFVGDVGEAEWEEINLIRRGGNYGWSETEGPGCFTEGCSPEDFIGPIFSYPHTEDEGRSVTGGYVYRGRRTVPIYGQYLFADFVSGRIWSLEERGPDRWIRREVAKVPLLISSFGEDEEGELYAAHIAGRQVWKIDFFNRDVLPHFATGGSGGVTMVSEIQIQNPSASSSELELSFFNSSGEPIEVTVEEETGARLLRRIPARSSSSLHVVSPGEELIAGWAEVVSERPLEVAIVMQVRDGVSTLETSLSSAHVSKEFAARVERDAVSGLNTAFAVLNPSPSENAVVEIELRDESGGLFSEAVHELPAGSRGALFIDEIMAIDETFSGTVRFLSNHEIAITSLRTRDGVLLYDVEVSAE